MLSEDELVQLNARREKVSSSYHDPSVHAKVSACGGGPQAPAGGMARPTVRVEAADADDEAWIDPADILGEERIDEFFDPRGFARQRMRAKRQSAQLVTMSDEELDREPQPTI